MTSAGSVGVETGFQRPLERARDLARHAHETGERMAIRFAIRLGVFAIIAIAAWTYHGRY
jgi:hypothetical protein